MYLNKEEAEAVIHYLELFWLSHTLLLGACISQIKFKLVWVLSGLILLGTLGNVLVIKFNDGEMPAFFSAAHSPSEVKSILQNNPKHKLATKDTKLALLADRIEIEKLQVICSIGDLIMLVSFNVFGMFVLWQIRKIDKNFFKNNTQISHEIMILVLSVVYFSMRSFS